MRGQLAIRSLIIVFCVAVAAGPIIATAQQAGRGQGRGQARQGMFAQQRWWQNETVASRLELGEDQIQRLDAIADDYQQKTRAARQQYARIYAGFIDLLSNYEADEESISGRREAVSEARTAVMALSIDQLLEVRSVLTPEQWSILPEVAPRAIRLGQVAVRGSGTVSTGGQQQPR